MDDEFGDSGADASFDTGGDFPAEDTTVDQSSDSSDPTWDSDDSVNEDVAEAIPEDPPSECEADDGDRVGSDEAFDAIEELPPDDDSGSGESDALADSPPDDGADSGEDGGVDLNEDELEDEVSSADVEDPMSESSEPLPSELAEDSEGDSSESTAEDSGESEMISDETLPEDSADSIGENEEESSENLSVDDVEQEAEAEEQAAEAEVEQAAEEEAKAAEELSEQGAEQEAKVEERSAEAESEQAAEDEAKAADDTAEQGAEQEDEVEERSAEAEAERAAEDEAKAAEDTAEQGVEQEAEVEEQSAEVEAERAAEDEAKAAEETAEQDAEQEAESKGNGEDENGKFESLIEPSTEVTDEVYREANVANEMYDDLRDNGKSYEETMDTISSGKGWDKVELDRGTELARVEDGEHRFNEESIYYTTDDELNRQGVVDVAGNVNEDVAKEKFALPEYARNSEDGSVIGERSADVVSHREVEEPIKAYASEVAPVRDSNGTDVVEHEGGARQIVVPDTGALSDYKEASVGVGLKDILAKASAEGEASASSDVPPPKGEGADDKCRADQRNENVIVNQMIQKKHQRGL